MWRVHHRKRRLGVINGFNERRIHHHPGSKLDSDAAPDYGINDETIRWQGWNACRAVSFFDTQWNVEQRESDREPEANELNRCSDELIVERCNDFGQRHDNSHIY